MLALTVGQKLPIKYQNSQHEFAVCDIFNSENFNSMIVKINDPTAKEINSLRSGEIKIGIYYDYPVIVIAIDLDFIVLDCTLDMRLYQHPNILAINSENDRMTLTLLCVNEDDILVAMRYFTLSPELTQKLCRYANEQLTINYTKEEFDKKLSEIYALSSVQLLTKIDMYEIGK